MTAVVLHLGDTLTRAQIRALLRRQVAAGVITRSQAEDILAAWDAGDLDTVQVPPDLDLTVAEQAKDDEAGAVLVSVLLAVATVAIGSHAGQTWVFQPGFARYVSPTGRTLDPAILRR